MLDRLADMGWLGWPPGRCSGRAGQGALRQRYRDCIGRSWHPITARRTASLSPQPAARLWRLTHRTKLASERMANPRHALTDPAQTMPLRTHLAGRGVAGALSSGSVPAQCGEYGHPQRYHTRISVHAAATASSMPGRACLSVTSTGSNFARCTGCTPLWRRSPPGTSAASRGQCSDPGTSAALLDPQAIMRCTFATAISISRVARAARDLQAPAEARRERCNGARRAFPHHQECPIRKRRSPGKAAYSTFVLARRIAESLNRRQKENPAA